MIKMDLLQGMNRFFIIIVFYVTFGYMVNPLKGLDLGSYPSKDRSIKDLFEVIDNSDRSIRCHKSNLFSLKIGSVTEGKKNLVKFSLKDLDLFLKKEKHKNCLVLFLDKGVAISDDDSGEKVVESLLNAFGAYKYKRILVVSARGSGAVLLADWHFQAEGADKQ